MTVPADDNNPNQDPNPNPAGDGLPAGDPAGTGGEPGNQGGDGKPAGSPQPAGDGRGVEHSVPVHVLIEERRARQQAERELAQFRNQRQPQQPVDADPKPRQDDFSDFSDFTRAEARWEGRQAAKETIQQERQRQAQEKVYQDRATATQTAIAKYREKTASEDASFHNTAMSLPLGDDLWSSVMESDHSPALVKHFAANPAEIYRLQGLGVRQMEREVGRLEAKLAGAGGQPQKVTQMPKTITPVGSGKGNGGEVSGLDKALRILYPA